MKKTIDKYDFIQEFDNFGRKSQYSVSGLEALFEYLEDNNTEMELDVIALCCEYSDYDEDGLRTDYGYLMDDESYEIEDLIE